MECRVLAESQALVNKSAFYHHKSRAISAGAEKRISDVGAHLDLDASLELIE